MDDHNPKISIIVPVYKVEDYIDRCIISILSQTYKNLEIILVDDGSPDSCGEICENYAEKDPRIRVIHQANMGLSMARNNGMKIATGDFIGFVDSDDFVDATMFESMLRVALDYDLNVVECSVNVDGEVFYPQNPEIVCIQDFDNVLERPFMMGFNSAWNKLYRTDFIKDFSFRKGMIYEDFLFTSQIWNKIDKIGFIPMAFYHYSQESTSIMRSDYSIKKIEGFWGINEGFKLFKGLPKKKSNREKLRKMFLVIARFHFHSLIENKHLDPNLKNLKRMKNIFSENVRFTYTNPYYLLITVLPVKIYIQFYRLNKCRLKFQKNIRTNS